MYFASRDNVNGAVVGFGGQWLLFVATPDGLRLSGAFSSSEAALAAMGAR